MKIEPLTQRRLAEIRRGMSNAQALVLRIGTVDMTKGIGIIDDLSYVLWTRDGKEIKITRLERGGWIGSVKR